MNRIEAEKIDRGSVYADWDEPTNMHGVFGTESGFCYELYMDEESAKIREKQLKDEYKGIN